MASSKFTSKVPSLASRMSAFMLSLKTQKSSKTRLLVPKNTGDNLPPTPLRLSVYGERLVYRANVVFLASQSTRLAVGRPRRQRRRRRRQMAVAGEVVVEAATTAASTTTRRRREWAAAVGQASAAAATNPDATPGAFANCVYDAEACPDKLLAAEFCEVKRLGALGDGFAKAGDDVAAQAHWEEALQIYAGRQGCGVQRAIKSRLYSRQAAAAVELADWRSACTYASQALSVDETNARARLRRVRALLELGGTDALEQVSADVERIKADGGTLSRDTLDRLRALVVSVEAS